MGNKLGKTGLFASWQGGHLVVADEGLSTGNRFWVDSAVGSNTTGYGRSPDAPFASLAYAFSSDVLTASNGDIVYVKEGHTEVCIAAGTITADIAGVRVVGLGHGNLRPKFTFTTAATASFLVSAANVSIENVIFDTTGIDSLNNPLNITGAGCTIRNCEFEHTDATGQADCAILTEATADDLLIENCYFFGSSDAGTSCAIDLVGGDSVRIVGNTIYGSYTTSVGGIRSATTATTNLTVKDNIIINATAISTKAFIAHAGTTGLVEGNHFAILSGSTPITAAAMHWGQNTYTNAVNGYAVEMSQTGSLATGAISASTFAAGAIDATAIAAGAIDAATFAADAIDAASIATGAIVAATFAAGAIDAAAIKDAAIDAATFAADAIDAAAIATGAIVAATFAAGAIDAAAIKDAAIDAATFAADAIDAAAIATGAIVAATFAAGAIDAAAIATNAIDADALAADAVAEIADGVLDESLTSHLTAYTVGASLASVEMCCEKSNGAVLGVDDPIFDITGGPIKILEIAGIVTTQIGAGATLVKLQLDTTAPGATVEMNAGTVDIDADAVGTSYRSINTTGVFTAVTAGFVLQANSFATNPTEYFAPIGTIQFSSDNARDGNIKWYLRYKPLSPNSKVAAAA